MGIMKIKENLSKTISEIQDVCKSCNRDPEDVKLIVVSKRKPLKMITEAFDAGQIDFGENNVMEAKEKFEQLANDNVRWHIIGSLQTNKVKYITGFCHLLHSLDRPSLADKLQQRLEFEDKYLECLIQVNTSGEETKSGVSPERLQEFAEYVSNKNRIRVKGLMTIAENSNDDGNIRKNFSNLREIFEALKIKNIPNFDMKELSMGMSNDYKIAIEEGATMIRVGSAIFGKRD